MPGRAGRRAARCSISPRRADRDRRRLPHPRRARASPARAWSRSARPTARRSPTTRAALGPGDRRASCACTSRTSASSGSRTSRRYSELAALGGARTALPVVDDLGSGQLTDLPEPGRRADARGRASRRARRSSASPATSCSAARRPASSSARADGDRAPPPASAGARAADRQALAGGARGDARLYRDPARAPARDPGAAHGRRAGRARCARAPSGWPRGSAARSWPTTARVGGGARAAARAARASRARSTAANGWRRALRSGGAAGRRRASQEGRVLLDCRTLSDDECRVAAARAARPLTLGTAGPHRPRQDGAGGGAHRRRHRPAAGGEGARHLDRARLRAARAAVRPRGCRSSTCPGHERFVRTMVAGATGIDLCLLVVACDDGVMPQTREHARDPAAARRRPRASWR